MLCGDYSKPSKDTFKSISIAPRIHVWYKYIYIPYMDGMGNEMLRSDFERCWDPGIFEDALGSFGVTPLTTACEAFHVHEAVVACHLEDDLLFRI